MHCHKMQMDAKLSMEMFEKVFELGSRGCMAVANYMREVQVFHFSVDLICLRMAHWCTALSSIILNDHAFYTWIGYYFGLLLWPMGLVRFSSVLCLKLNQTKPNHLYKTKTKLNHLWTLKPFKPNHLRKGKSNHLNQHRLGKS